MARPMIVLDDPGHETKKRLQEIGFAVDRPYSWVLRRLVANAHARVFASSSETVRKKELTRLGLK